MTQFAALSWTVKRKQERSSFVMWKDIGCWGERTSEDVHSGGRAAIARSPCLNFVFNHTGCCPRPQSRSGAAFAPFGRRCNPHCTQHRRKPLVRATLMTHWSISATQPSAKSWNECTKYMLVHLLWHTFIWKTMCACYLEHKKKKKKRSCLSCSWHTAAVINPAFAQGTEKIPTYWGN